MLKIDVCAAAKHKIILSWPNTCMNHIQRKHSTKQAVINNFIFINNCIRSANEDAVLRINLPAKIIWNVVLF